MYSRVGQKWANGWSVNGAEAAWRRGYVASAAAQIQAAQTAAVTPLVQQQQQGLQQIESNYVGMYLIHVYDNKSSDLEHSEHLELSMFD